MKTTNIKRNINVCHRCDKFEETPILSADGRNEVGYRCGLVDRDGFILYYEQFSNEEIPDSCEKKDLQAYEQMMTAMDTNRDEMIKSLDKNEFHTRYTLNLYRTNGDKIETGIKFTTELENDMTKKFCDCLHEMNDMLLKELSEFLKRENLGLLGDLKEIKFEKC